jgi:hypothetical protein
MTEVEILKAKLDIALDMIRILESSGARYICFTDADEIEYDYLQNKLLKLVDLDRKK